MKGNKLGTITKILAILLISLISFVGIYVQKGNQMKNIVKDYTKGMDFAGYRKIVFKVSEETEEVVYDSEGNLLGHKHDFEDEDIESNGYTTAEVKVNEEASLTTENYKKAKEIIEARLKELKVEDYIISVDEQTGSIYMEIPEDSNADHIVSNIYTAGEFEIKDSEDGTVLLDNNQIKSAQVLYNTDTSGTTVYLSINFTKEGKDILKDISTNQYATIEETSEDENTTATEDTTSEGNTTSEESAVDEENTTNEENTEDTNSTETESEEAEEEVQKEIILAIDDETLITTSFDDPIENGEIDLSMNTATTDTTSLTNSITSTQTMATLLNTGALPITYVVEQNEFIASDITSDFLFKVLIVAIVIVLVALVYMIIKYKKQGILTAISFIGFVALYLLVIRYTNSLVTIESLLGIALVLMANYALNMEILKNKENKKQAFIENAMKLIPILIVSIIFCFIEYAKISSFGMIVFWGILIMEIYNLLLVRTMVD